MSSAISRDDTPIDPASALREFYKEEDLEMPTQRVKVEKPSVAVSTLDLESLLNVIKSECNADVSVYKEEHIGLNTQSPAQVVLQLDTVRERVSLGEVIMKKASVCPLYNNRIVSFDHSYEIV